MNTRKLVVGLAAVALAATMAAPAAAQGQGRGTSVTSADVLDQMDAEGDRAVWAEDGATLRRTPNAIQVRVEMPTPQPNTYNYPDPDVHPTAAAPGHPEVFTLWAFVFNHPEDCVAGPHDCGMADVQLVMATGGADNPGGLAVFGAAGHPVGGPHLTLAGGIATTHEPFAPIFAPLTNPAGAEVHLAVAPHGGLDPTIMPEQASTPAGTPDLWWVAVFLSPAAD